MQAVGSAPLAPLPLRAFVPSALYGGRINVSDAPRLVLVHGARPSGDVVASRGRP